MTPRWVVTKVWTLEAPTAAAALLASDTDVTHYGVDVRPAAPWESATDWEPVCAECHRPDGTGHRMDCSQAPREGAPGDTTFLTDTAQ